MGDVDAGNVAGAAASGAAMGTAVMPGWGTAAGALIGGGIELFREMFGRDPTEAEQAEAAQYAGGHGAPLTNHLAALDYSEGLTQQQSQNAREAGFYSQAGGNFDIANAAQLRDAPQVQKDFVDEQRQLDALNLTRNSGDKLTNTGDKLTALGTRPMGDSYAEAQLRQGQQAAMAQQLSMARSGRSLGSGQASMANAAFNNAALNQQTNQAAAAARIQEQNAYNQFQANALGQAGNQYGAAGNQYGAAGAQGTTIRQGNEGLQKTNADLTQNQQTVNNQTSQIYNTLGSQQQNLGMDANRLGTNAFQFGAQQGQTKQISQLNADVGQTSSTTAVNLDNAAAERARETARLAAMSGALAQGAEAFDNFDKGGSSGGTASGSQPATNPNDAYKNITDASHVTPSGNQAQGQPGSDEKNKTGIQPLEQPRFTGLSAPSKTPAYGTPGYTDWANAQMDDWKKAHPMPKVPQGSPEFAAWQTATQQEYNRLHPASKQVKTADPNNPNIVTVTKEDGSKETMDFTHGANTAMDEDTRKIPVTGETGSYTGPRVAGYVETIHALNEAYRPSQFAPADILNHVAGAGSGPSASQSDVIDRMRGRRPAERERASSPDALKTDPKYAASTDLQKAAGAPGGLSKLPAPKPAAPPPPAWGDVFKQPRLSSPVDLYLRGFDPYVAPPPAPVAAPTPSTPPPGQYRGSECGVMERPPTPPGAGQYRGSEQTATSSSGEAGRPSGIELKKNIIPIGPPGPIGSDEHSKERIRELEGQLQALSPAEQRPEGVDFRNAHGYSYEYKDPKQKGAVPGIQVGTMAQELERTDGAPYVHDTPQGKTVDTSRLPLALAPAIGHTQRRVDDLERQLDALKGAGFAGHQQGLYPSTRSPY
jgi:hypothetical protein